MDLKDLDITHLAPGDSISIEKFHHGCFVPMDEKCIIVKEPKGYSISWLIVGYEMKKETGSRLYYPEEAKTIVDDFEKSCLALAKVYKEKKDSIIKREGNVITVRMTMPLAAYKSYAIRSENKIWMFDNASHDNWDAFQAMENQLSIYYEGRKL